MVLSFPMIRTRVINNINTNIYNTKLKDTLYIDSRN